MKKTDITAFRPPGAGVPDEFTQVHFDETHPDLYEWSVEGGALNLRNLGDTVGGSDKTLRWDTPGTFSKPASFVEVASLVYFEEIGKPNADVGISMRMFGSGDGMNATHLRLHKDGATDSPDFPDGRRDVRLTSHDTTVPHDTSADLGFTEGWHFFRFRIGVDGLMQGKAWRRGDVEPDWMVDHQFDNAWDTPGYIGLTQIHLFNERTRWAYLAYGVDEPAPLLFPRVRSNVSASVGSLLEATDAPALESNVREAFFEGVNLPVGGLYSFMETIAPGQARTLYYPNPVTSGERLSEYAGSTKLGRMADAYPSAFVSSAQDVVGQDEMTAQELLTALFAAWADEFPWFTYKEVPDLRYRLESGDYSGSGVVGDPGVLTVPAVFYPQDRDEGRRLSMRGIVDDILAIYPGTALMQDSEGDIVLRPTYGPDADATAVKTLALSDAFSITTGLRPDPRRIYNQARVSFRGGEFQEAQQVLPDTFLLGSRFDETVLTEDDEDVSTDLDTYERAGPTGEWGYLQAAVDYADETPLVSTGDDMDVEYTIEMYSTKNPDYDINTLVFEGSKTDTITLTAGGPLETDTFTDTPLGNDVTVEFGFRWDSDNQQVIVRLFRDSHDSRARAFWGGNFASWDTRYLAYILKFNAFATAFVQANETVEAEFGYDLTEDEVPDGSGGNALESNQLAYGEREVSLSTTAFAASPSQAGEIAQALVLHHMTPRIVRTVEQSYSSKYGILPDHIGRLVELPTTETALVEERTYTDDYTNVQAPALASTFKATVVGDPVGLPDQDGNTTQEDPPTGTPNDEGILAFDSGAWLRFDSGVLVEET